MNTMHETTTTTAPTSPAEAEAKRPWWTHGALIAAALFLLPPAGAALAWRRKDWKKATKVTLTVLAAVYLLVLMSGGDEQSATPQAAAPAPVKAPKAAKPAKAPKAEPGLNTAVRDGKFEFTVTKVTCGKSQVGSGYLTRDAQGQYCLVSVSVRNVGDSAQPLLGDNQKLLDASGREYSADAAAGIYLPDSHTLFEPINPGNTLRGTLAFDVPTDLTPSAIELHDSMFSRGIKVKVA